jgi:hypothetical protein
VPSIESFKTKRGVVWFTDDAVLVKESVSEYARSLYQGYWQKERWGCKTIFVGRF